MRWITFLLQLLMAGCASSPTPDIRICEGCGTQWETPKPEPNPKPIKQCPKCPMTLKELEQLQEELRKQNNEAK
jgi:hypothetical protein